MPIDASIALGVRPPGQVEGPLDTYAKTIQLKDMMNQGRLRNLQERESEQNLEAGVEALKGQRTRNQLDMKKIADEEAAGEIIKKYLVKTDEDGTYSFDHDAVEGAMARAGLNPLSYREKRLDIEKKTDDAIKAHLDTKWATSVKLGKVAQAVLNAPEDLRPGVYNFSLKQALAQGLITPEQIKDPAMQQYVPGKTDQFLQQLADMALDNPFEAMLKRQQMKTDQMRQQEQAAKTLAEQTAVESQLLSAAKTPAEWANALAQLPEDRQKMYPAEFSEPARANVEQSGMKPETRLTLAETKRHNFEMEKRAVSATSVETDAVSQDIASAIADGLQPPVLTGLYRYSGPVRGKLAKMGYDLTTATRDWQSITRHISTLNGPQQERLRQAITFTAETIPQIKTAYDEWKRLAVVSGFKIFNRAALNTMKNLPGDAGSAATNLDALIADFTSEIGTVYKGGNSSTDESLRLAAQNLSADWNEKTFNDALKRLDQSVKIRYNSIMNSEPVGVSVGSKFAAGRGPITDDLINKVMADPDNAGATREEIITALEEAGYRRDE